MSGRQSATVHVLRPETNNPSIEAQKREARARTFLRTVQTHLPESSWNIASESVELLSRYPDLTSIELDRLIGMYPKIPMLQVALMSADEELAPKLEAFQKTWGRKIRTPIRQIAGLLAPLALLIGLVLWLML